LLDLGEKVMKGRESTKTTLALIERADLPFRAGEWFIVRAVAVVIGLAGGWLFGAESPVIPLAAGALVGLAVPPLALRFLAARRAKQFERQLPGILMLVSTSLKSGFGLPQALDGVAKDTAEPAAKEFSRALAETRIGTDITEAVEKMGDRMGSVSMRWAVMSIRIQRDVGGNLADTLRTTANTLRERESLQRQVSALSAEGRLSAYILIAMPIFLFFYMMRVNYDYVSLLWTDQIGVLMAIGGIVMMLIGVVWMQKIVKIEV
jgi:tight adherence protein B